MNVDINSIHKYGPCNMGVFSMFREIDLEINLVQGMLQETVARPCVELLATEHASGPKYVHIMMCVACNS